MMLISLAIFIYIKTCLMYKYLYIHVHMISHYVQMIVKFSQLKSYRDSCRRGWTAMCRKRCGAGGSNPAWI